jgi:hypothetical protein
MNEEGPTVIIRLDCAGQLTDGFDVPSTGSHSVELLITPASPFQPFN